MLVVIIAWQSLFIKFLTHQVRNVVIWDLLSHTSILKTSWGEEGSKRTESRNMVIVV